MADQPRGHLEFEAANAGSWPWSSEMPIMLFVMVVQYLPRRSLLSGVYQQVMGKERAGGAMLDG